VHYAPQWIKDEVDAFATRELCSRDKIRVSGYQNNLIDLALEAQGCDVQPDAHIHAFLRRRILEVVIDQVPKIEAPIQELLQASVPEPPLGMFKQMAEAQCDFALFPQLVMERQAKCRLRCFGKIDRRA